MLLQGLVALTAVLALRPPPCGSRKQTAKIEIAALRTAAWIYTAEHPDLCPDLDRLVEAGVLADHRRTTDPWGNDYLIECEGGETIVSSNGPDGLPDTEDDIR